MRWIHILCLPLLVLLLPACESHNPPGPFSVVEAGFQPVVDESRERSFESLLWYPQNLSVDDPRPLLVFSHGLSGLPEEGAWLAEYLASHGYIVVAPRFPWTNRDRGMDIKRDDILNQPGDISRLIDAVLAGEFSEVPSGVVNADQIALAGHSFGGLTSYLATYDVQMADPRVKAVVLMAAAGGDFLESDFYKNRHVPLLLLHGDNDLLVELPSTSQVAFKRANVSRALVSYRGGNHLGFGGGSSYGFNPDKLACWFAGSMFEDTGGRTFYQQLRERTPDTGIGDYFAPLPCQYEVPDVARMSAGRHRFISQQLILSFFEAQWGDNKDQATAELDAYFQQFSGANEDVNIDVAL